MACFWNFYEEYLEKVSGEKNESQTSKQKKKMSVLKLLATKKILM